MAHLTDAGENVLVDWFRGAGLTLPATFYVALGSAADDTTFTELSGTDYARQPIARSADDWAGTQGPASTLPSSGTSHSTSNNVAIDFGTAGAAWGTANVVGLFDALTDGVCLMWAPVAAPVVVDEGDPVELAAGTLTFTLGAEGGMSDYTANKVIDAVFRGATDWDWPAVFYVGYAKTAPTNSTPGAEPVGGGYARGLIGRSFADWSATSAPGSSDPSTGTDGRTSNNVSIEFPVPTANQGTVTHVQIWDVASGPGNMLFWRQFANGAKTLTTGGLPPRFDADQLGITFQ
jgi:hypothetical protein